jgi:hypothetical protein
MNPSAEATPAKAWWQFGHVWLVLAGPAVVVVASFVTLWLALRAPDPLIDIGPSARPAAAAPAASTQGQALVPAMKARNHAATGAVPSSP